MLKSVTEEIKQIDQKRTRNTIKWFVILVVLGVVALIVAATAEYKLVGDFSVNMSAGFISAAILALVIDRAYMNRQEQNQQRREYLKRVQKIMFLLQRVDNAVEQSNQTIKAANDLMEDIREKQTIFRNWNYRDDETYAVRFSAIEGALLVINEIQTMFSTLVNVEQTVITQHHNVLNYHQLSIAKVEALNDDEYLEMELNSPHSIDKIYSTVLESATTTKRLIDYFEQQLSDTSSHKQAINELSEWVGSTSNKITHLKALMTELENLRVKEPPNAVAE